MAFGGNLVRIVAAVLALVFAPGCLGGQHVQYLRIEGDASLENVELVQAAVREWNEACGEEILAFGEGGDLVVSFYDTVDEEALAVVKNGEQEDALEGSWAGQRTGDRIDLFRMPERDREHARSTVAHELGHFLTGKGHPTDATPSIMRVLGTEGRRMAVQPADVASIAANGYVCPRGVGR